jgi:DNA polymerase III epsilon subunit
MQLLFALDEHVVFDLETTGLSAWGDEIIEIGAMKIYGNEIDDKNTFHTLVNPKRLIPPDAMKIHGITNEMVQDAPTIEEVFPKFLEYVGGAWLIAQNAKFDMSFIMKYMMQYKIKKQLEVWDTIHFSRRIYPTENRHNLDIICTRLGLRYDQADRHRSMTDVLLTAKAFVAMREMLGEKCPPREKYEV